MLFKVGSLFSTAPPATESLPDKLHKDLESLNQNVVSHGNSIRDWDGRVFAALSIVSSSAKLNNEIKGCIAVTKTLQTWTGQEEKKSISLAHELSQAVDGVIQETIAARPKFSDIPFLGDTVALAVVRSLRASATELVGLLVSLVKQENLQEAEAIAAKINQRFADALKAFGDVGVDSNDTAITGDQPTKLGAEDK